MSTKANRRATVFNTISDSVSNFIYYDRKEDEGLPRGAIEKMIEDSEISVDEIVDEFAGELRKGFKK